ncbi:hypothetical protein [Pedobacter deserti]|uniref:hypothetical protein n=1 Tax=Pedobacter deserti TaxID=2817382 RepID=UPI0021092D91|nr:hypothetical protein [Pedobacter sp. SYSU D00382]
MRKNSGQTSQYDKIIKENLEATLPAIMKDLLHLDIVASEELPDDIQHTKERKPDALKKVTDSAGDTYVLHLEFQVANEAEMVYRMAEYSVMLMRRYKLPVKQFVIFLNEVTPQMKTEIDTPCHKYKYELIRVSETNPDLYLRSEVPHVKMMGILANIPHGKLKEDLQAIVDGIARSTESDLEKNKLFNQLRIFVQLRSNLVHQLEEIMQSVSTFFKEENDIFYRRGEARGEARGAEREKAEIAKHLKSKGIDIMIISEATGLTIKEIEKL